MPISERLRAVGALVLVAGLLAACDPAALSGVPSRTRVDVADLPVVVTAPAGFCIDRESTRRVDDGAFVLMTDCALLGGTPDPARPPLGAAFTATILPGSLAGEGAAPTAALDEVGAFLRTPEGRAMLGGGRVAVLRSVPGDGALFVLIEDGAGPPMPGVSARYWRGFVALDGRFAVLTALPFESGRMDEQAALEGLASLAANLRRANL